MWVKLFVFSLFWHPHTYTLITHSFHLDLEFYFQQPFDNSHMDNGNYLYVSLRSFIWWDSVEKSKRKLQYIIEADLRTFWLGFIWSFVKVRVTKK